MDRSSATDGTLNLEDVSDNLGAGLGHQGFYTSLFPDDGDRSLVKAPYQRIVETVKQIASQAKSDKKTQVFVTGASWMNEFEAFEGTDEDR